jgi:hypothetical protein
MMAKIGFMYQLPQPNNKGGINKMIINEENLKTLRRIVKEECIRRSLPYYSIGPILEDPEDQEEINEYIGPYDTMIKNQQNIIKTDNYRDLFKFLEKINEDTYYAYTGGNNLVIKIAGVIEEVSKTDYHNTDCKSSCTGLCQEGCYTNCLGGCGGTCIGDCEDGCTDGCTSDCSGWCESNNASIPIDCGGECTSGCQGSCTDSCTEGCGTECANFCS